ncbi:MAG: tyrosine-type recombinase/integrase [Anaerolineales bacterium]|nr:tyrosine-type recombinase/integrase [Anaerolineales bacterium]
MDTPTPAVPTIQMAMADFVDMVKRSRSANTALSYAKGLLFFSRVLEERGLPALETPADRLTEDSMPWLLDALEAYSPATEQLYVVAAKRFFNFLSARNLAEINFPRLNEFVLQQTRRPGQRLPQFPREEIEDVLVYIMNHPSSSDSAERLRDLRDRAFLLTLADSGLRVHEACGLRRGDIDWNEGQAIIIGKGNKQAVVRFSNRILRSLKDYLAARAGLDGGSGRPLPSLPLFARHDKGAGKKVKPISTTTGRDIVNARVRQALGEEAEKRITPHSFRHYFVTSVLRASGNLKLAQELARHANIQVTQKYAHLSNDELDRGYRDIFDKDVI